MKTLSYLFACGVFVWNCTVSTIALGKIPDLMKVFVQDAANDFGKPIAKAAASGFVPGFFISAWDYKNEQESYVAERAVKQVELDSLLRQKSLLPKNNTGTFAIIKNYMQTSAETEKQQKEISMLNSKIAALQKEIKELNDKIFVGGDYYLKGLKSAATSKKTTVTTVAGGVIGGIKPAINTAQNMITYFKETPAVIPVVPQQINNGGDQPKIEIPVVENSQIPQIPTTEIKKDQSMIFNAEEWNKIEDKWN